MLKVDSHFLHGILLPILPGTSIHHMYIQHTYSSSHCSGSLSQVGPCAPVEYIVVWGTVCRKSRQENFSPYSPYSKYKNAGLLQICIHQCQKPVRSFNDLSITANIVTYMVGRFLASFAMLPKMFL